MENTLAALYPGCRDNFQWLIRQLFLLKPTSCEQQESNSDPSLLILQWLLISVRSWDVSDLDTKRDLLRSSVEKHYPGLAYELESALRLIPANCTNTKEALGFACEIANIIKKYAQLTESFQNPQQEEKVSNPPLAQKDPAQALQSLQNLLSVSTDDTLPCGMGETIREIITDACARQGERMQVAVEANKSVAPLDPSDRDSARQATTALRTRLQALLQSTRSVRNRNAYAGTLNIRKLHNLAKGDAKIFLRKGQKVGVNTTVHILVDSSGSMHGTPIQLASQACFAIASALHGIKGISVGVTAFPGEAHASVVPILRHGEKMHSRFSLSAMGSTPMDAALWWAWQHLSPMPEARKIILLITDGKPDSDAPTLAAIKAIQDYGWELYGIGVGDAFIQTLLPGRNRIINDIKELAPVMFGMLQAALVGKKEARG